ncbi:WYL domain-containing protein [uncultured Polaribacter sp.]|uniref:helix-turn-helix transcriptional regulator n=1 Tax=uncultured Polaribacter sp. TaxID=174711 RepID=UPI00260D2254|nr:WYL domain-containing protein [uncultured Polaribacter sp.]
MSTNKNAILRYQTLDKCFRNPGKRYFINDLIEECNEALFDYDPSNSGIQKRQIYDDILFMKDSKGYNAPIEEIKEGRSVYRRYSDLNFSINNQPINESEATQLKEALMTLNRFKGMPQFEWVNDLSTRLESSFGLLTSDEPVIGFENNPYVSGLEYISVLYRAIIYKTPLKIISKSFTKNTEEEYELHPYYLKQYNNRWFVFGYNVSEGIVFKKALDRIESIKELKTEFINSGINFEEYFEDAIGVTVKDNQKPQKVKIRVSKDLWPYVQTKPIHESQSSGNKENLKTLEKGYLDITLQVVLNYELESKILERGEGFEVLEPLELRNKIAKRIGVLTKKYS